MPTPQFQSIVIVYVFLVSCGCAKFMEPAERCERQAYHVFSPKCPKCSQTEDKIFFRKQPYLHYLAGIQEIHHNPREDERVYMACILQYIPLIISIVTCAYNVLPSSFQGHPCQVSVCRQHNDVSMHRTLLPQVCKAGTSLAEHILASTVCPMISKRRCQY